MTRGRSATTAAVAVVAMMLGALTAALTTPPRDLVAGGDPTSTAVRPAPADAAARPDPARDPARPDPSRAAAGAFQDPDLTATGTLAAQGLSPVRVQIPTIGVDTALERLDLRADGALSAPEDWQSAGWYAGGVVPGDVGPGVVAGHVDSPDGPAVFWDLTELRPGDQIVVTLSDGSTRTFATDRSVRAAKAGFPSSQVYRSTPTPELRLITCDGAFDRATGHYEDNLVVFASLVG